MRTEKPAPNEVAVRVTAVMNTKSTHNELQMVNWWHGQKRIWLSFKVNLFCYMLKHKVNVSMKFKTRFNLQSHAYTKATRIMPGAIHHCK